MERSLDRPRYALVARLPRQIEVRIEDAFLNLLGTSKPSMGYHITVIGPFLWLTEADEIHLHQVGVICQEWEPFQVRITGLSAFRTTNDNAVYIHTAEPGQLLELHQALLDHLKSHIILQRELPPEGYLPHVTLGLGLTDKELDKVMAGSGDQEFDETFAIQDLCLVKQEPSNPWRHALTFPLGRGEAKDDGDR